MSLTAVDICKIIEVCRQNNVERIVVDDARFEVCFAKPIAEAPLHAPTPNRAVSEDEITMHPIKLEDTSRDPVAEIEQDEIAELVISDPARFEEMLGRGELIDEPRQPD